MTLAIEVKGVTKRFGSTVALDDVSLSVDAGNVLALLGPNGAGKTTLIRVLTTLLVPDSGHARVAGLDVRKDAKAIRSLIGLAGQYASVDELLTGRENLELVGLLYHLERAEYRRRAQEALERMTLTDAGDRPVKTYSGGMRRRLDLAASLIGRPPILFLDEPTTGLDPRTRNDLWAVHRRARGRGDHRAAHHPVHGGGGAPGRPDRRPRHRTRRRPGDGRRAQGPAGRRRPRDPGRRRADLERAAALVAALGTRCRRASIAISKRSACPSRAVPRCSSPPGGRSTTAASPSTTSGSGGPRSTTCSCRSPATTPRPRRRCALDGRRAGADND